MEKPLVYLKIAILAAATLIVSYTVITLIANFYSHSLDMAYNKGVEKGIKTQQQAAVNYGFAAWKISCQEDPRVVFDWRFKLLQNDEE